jgi:hypothetical protein
MKRLALILAGLVGLAWLGFSLIVELDGPYRREALGGADSGGKALVLYHPSRDAHFSDDLSDAFAQALVGAGFQVERATLTAATPGRPAGYNLVAVVTNTYYWTPDLPTLRYLKRAQFEGTLLVGLIGGAGSTGRAERILDAALRRTGGTVFQTRSFWLWRPNDESRKGVPNREVALDQARELALQAAARVLQDRPLGP